MIFRILTGRLKEGLSIGSFEKLVYDHNEASASALSPNRYKELVYFYEQFKKKWGQQ